MILRFEGYEVTDGGITLHFVAPIPPLRGASDYFILLTDAELAGVSTQAQLRTLVMNKLNRKIRATGIATKLDPFIGQTLTV